jgi:hypothetical protein
MERWILGTKCEWFGRGGIGGWISRRKFLAVILSDIII